MNTRGGDDVSKFPASILLSTLTALIVAQPLCAASWSPDGKRLAYSFIGGPENLYVMDADGGRARAILAREQRDFQPEWAPDGSFLVFTTVVDGVHQMMKILPDGTGLTALSEPAEAAGDPDVSPDGKWLVYFTDEPRPRDLYLRSLEDGTTKPLLLSSDFDEMSPRWDPEGERVVYVGKEHRDDVQGELWILEIASGATRRVTDTPQSSEFHPDWSHDGRKLVCIRATDGEFIVVLLDLESGDESIVAAGNGYAVLSPHFSPDDRFVTFTRTDFAEQGEGMPAIVQVSLEDGSETKLVQGLYLSQMR